MKNGTHPARRLPLQTTLDPGPHVHRPVATTPAFPRGAGAGAAIRMRGFAGCCLIAAVLTVPTRARPTQANAFADALKKSGIRADSVDAGEGNSGEMHERFGGPDDEKLTARVTVFLGETLGRLSTATAAADEADTKPRYGRRLSPGRHAVELTVDGWSRSYLVHVPPHIESGVPLPVVIMFHGGGGKADSARRDTGWDRKADREGFLAVFPEGTPPDSSRPGRFVGNPQTWNDGSGRNVAAVRRNAPDVAFVDALVNDLKTRCPVDARRIYVTGFSNGASMAFRVARERPELVTAAAPVAGADWLTGTQPTRPVPLLYITGSADPLNPLKGGEVRIGTKRYRPKPPVAAIIRRWLELHECRPTPKTVFDQDGAKGLAYSRPDAGSVVVSYTLEGHGHHWPGGKTLLPRRIAGPNTTSLRATDVIWTFFEQHKSPAQEHGE